MITEIFTRRLKGITGNGTTTPKFVAGDGKRLFGVSINIVPGAVQATLAVMLTALTEIRVFEGNKKRRVINGTRLHDLLLRQGANAGFDLITTTNFQIYIPFADESLVANVADSLAWDPTRLGGPIRIEIDSTVAITIDVTERVASNLGAPSSGILTWETITPIAGGTAFTTEPGTITPIGRLVSAMIYPDTTNSRQPNPVSLFVGANDLPVYDAVTFLENADYNLRNGVIYNTAGRSSADIYDMVFVRGDALAHSIDLESWGKARLKIQATAGAMAGVSPIVLERLENIPNN